MQKFACRTGKASRGGCKAVDSGPPTCNHSIHELSEITSDPTYLVAPLNWRPLDLM